MDADELVLGWHFEVVTDTPFDVERVDHFYELPNHTIDYDLVTTLGLGVVKNLLVEDDYYLYNASSDQPDHFGMMHEVTRMGVYYQITHPEYDGWDLEDLIIDTKGGKEFLGLLQTVDTDMPYKRLKDVFDRKKGVVLLFERNV